ncbi:uncharacterized protein LOC122267244 [Penaeus japonicus]|uniref:uncharacterized protein LOC122267244 n=1 Tax=Penaeus japonicus TaxID=27405 RepID=UPI001C70F0C5|nr:uncharacterized protein LOC122267244 [Penaeus japonicus]
MEQVSGSCPICLEPWDTASHTPKFLSCHHTLCLDCVSTLVGNAVAAEGGEGEGRGRDGGGDRRGGVFVLRGRGSAPWRPGSSEDLSSPSSISGRFFQSRDRPREPAAPALVDVLCPMCRLATPVGDPASLQTNFYLGALPRTPSVPRLLLWCEECDSIAEPACGDHNLKPLPDKIKAVKNEVTSSGLLLLDSMCSFAGEYHCHMEVYKWLCTLLRTASNQVSYAFEKTNNRYRAAVEQVHALQEMLDQCEEICKEEEDELMITELLRLRKTLQANRSSWLGLEDEGKGEKGGEEDEEKRVEGGIERTKGGGGGGAGGDSETWRCPLPVLQDLFPVHGALHPPEGFQKAQVVLQTRGNGATLSFSKCEAEKEEGDELDGFRHSLQRRGHNHKKGNNRKSLSFSVPDAAHRRLGPSRTPSAPTRTFRTPPVHPRTSPGSCSGNPTQNLAPSAAILSSRRGGPSTATPYSAEGGTSSSRFPVPISPPPSLSPVPPSFATPYGTFSKPALTPPFYQPEGAEGRRTLQAEEVEPGEQVVEDSCEALSPRPPLEPEPSDSEAHQLDQNIIDILESLEETSSVQQEPQLESINWRRRVDRRGRRRRNPGGGQQKNKCVII